MNIPLCGEHRLVQKSRVAVARGSLARQAANYYPLDEFPGFCYFALLPDSSVKIGYSNTETLMSKRFKALGRQHGGPVVKLAVVPGGFVAEAVMHDRFAESRIPGDGERFRYTTDIASFIADSQAL